MKIGEINYVLRDDYNEEFDDPKIAKDGLSQFNRDKLGDPGIRKLAIIAKDQSNEFAGGFLGFTAYGWLYVDTLWVVEKLRGQGLGKQLMQRAEAEARQRACHHVHLCTHELQAPAFYERLGYSKFGELNDFPEGFRLHFLSKRL